MNFDKRTGPSTPTNKPSSEVGSPNYVVNCLPSLIKKVVLALHDDTQIPVELISNVVLSASSLACQPLVEFIPPHSHIPEPCSLYLLTIAESGEGKTTISKKVMKPFYAYKANLRAEYQSKLADYKSELQFWREEEKVLKSDLRKAIRDKKEGISEKDALKEHAKKEPPKPILPNIIYEDASHRALIDGLSEYPFAGVILDEAVIFFKSNMKNNLGLLNKAWDGSSYDFRRSDGDNYNISPCLTILLMTQPGIFTSYLDKYGETARSNGFISRFLFDIVNSSIGQRQNRTSTHNSEQALSEFYDIINHLLEQQCLKFHKGIETKKTLTLDEEATALWNDYIISNDKKIAQGGEFYHIRDIVSKANSNALRIATIFTYLQNQDVDTISGNILNIAYKLIDWYIAQAEKLFYTESELYAFEQDVRDLYVWIRDKFKEYNGEYIHKIEIEQRGPGRLRRKKRLDPALDELISMGIIEIIRAKNNLTLLIAHTGRTWVPFQFPGDYGRKEKTYSVRTQSDTKPRHQKIDLSDLYPEDYTS